MGVSARRASLLALVGLLLVGSAFAQDLGDRNEDGLEDAADLVVFSSRVAGFGGPLTPEAIAEFDLDQDGSVGPGDVRFAADLLVGAAEPLVPLLVTSPAEDLLFTRSSNITVAGSVGEPSRVSVAGHGLGVVTGSFQTVVTLSKGLNVIDILARREGVTEGPYSIKNRTVVLDLDPPELEVTFPPHMEAISELFTTVRGTVADDISGGVRLAPRPGAARAPLEPPLEVFVQVRAVEGNDVVSTTTAAIDEFGDWEAPVTLALGLNDITVTATDAVDLQNAATIRVRTFQSEAGTATSPQGAQVTLPDAAMGDEEMVLRVHDVSTAEIEAALGIDLYPTPPPGGLENWPVGTIVMPNGMMLELENAPDNGLPWFQREAAISIPNVTGADNTMPIWIFQIQPDRDGDGRPELNVAARGKISEDGTRVIPLVDGQSALDVELPGPFSARNERFEEDELSQVQSARAVHDLMARIKGTSRAVPEGPNVLRARPRLKMPVAAIQATVLAAAIPPPLTPVPPAPPSARQSPQVILVDNFEGQDTLNELEPPGLTYTLESGSGQPHATDPIRPVPLTGDDMIGEGNPATSLGPNGGARLRGRFGPATSTGEARIVTTLLGRDLPYDLGTLDSPRMEFDARTTEPGAEYEVTIEDDAGAHNWRVFAPTSSWGHFSVLFSEIEDLDAAELRRITWRAKGNAGARMDLAVDNITFIGTGSVPATPTPIPTPSPSAAPSPTTTGTPNPSPSPSPQPTTTPPPVHTATPAPPTPTPDPDDDPAPPTATPIPTVSPDDGMDDGPQPKTQVTFFCCAASAIIPYKGKTKCDDDQNVDQQRLRQCIAEEQQKLRDCQDAMNAATEKLLESINRMSSGYRNLFGFADFGNGVEVPTIVGGSLFSVLTAGGGANATASLTQAGLGASANSLTTAADLYRLSQNGSPDDILQASFDIPSRHLSDFVSITGAIPSGQLPAQLQSRQGFSTGWNVSSGAINGFKAITDIVNMGDGYGDVAELNDLVTTLQINCEFIHKRLRKLKNCDKASNVWLDCNPGSRGGDEIKTAAWQENQELSRLVARGRQITKRALEAQRAFGTLQGQVETWSLSAERLRLAMEKSVEIESIAPQLSEPELRQRAADLANELTAAWEGFHTVFDNADEVEPALFEATRALNLGEQVDQQLADARNLVGRFVDYDERSNEGEPGALVSVGGQAGGTSSISGFGGKFTGYQFAQAGRSGDAVTFTGSSTTINARMPETLFSGSKPVAFPTLTFPFTPFSTYEFDQIVDVGTVPLATGVDDREGNFPDVDNVYPPAAKQAEPLSLPPGVPFLASGAANDDVVIFATRFLLDGEPTESLGSVDVPNDPGQYDFSGYFLTPELEDGEGTRDIVVQAQVIDAGGNISTATGGTITVDPDAPLLLTIAPKEVYTTTEGPNIQFAATVTATEAAVEDPLWFVDGVLGGNARVGTISGAGLYTPPSEVNRAANRFEVQVLSLSRPEAIGVADVFAAEPFAITDHVTVRNNTPPGIWMGYEFSGDVSVFNYPPRTSDRVSVLDIYPRGMDRVSVANPFTAGRLSGYEISPPVAVDQEGGK
ncbi:hypothetical protein HZA57_08650 [Candidatus Poribacteria bacterium]|nr:hypothetical protein [Candidatus Poribacteria bacterium]